MKLRASLKFDFQMISLVLLTIGLLIFLKETRSEGATLESMKFMFDSSVLPFIGAGLMISGVLILVMLYFWFKDKN